MSQKMSSLVCPMVGDPIGVLLHVPLDVPLGVHLDVYLGVPDGAHGHSALGLEWSGSFLAPSGAQEMQMSIHLSVCLSV